MSKENIYDLPMDLGSPTLEIPEGDTLIQRSILPGGIRVISQNVPASASVVLGLWVPVGSRDEGEEYLGSTHYLEHLLFKGTKRRNAVEIAQKFDAVGGDFNAATGKESTHYYCRVLAEDLPMAVEVLADMFIDPLLAQEDFDLERSVIIDELAMSQDDPSEVGFEALSAAVFGDQPIGRPVGGSPETVSATPLSAVKTHHQRWYQPEYLIVSAAGGVKHEQLCELIEQAVAKSTWQLKPLSPQEPSRSLAPIHGQKQQYIEKDVEQAQVLLGIPSVGVNHEKRDLITMLLTVLSGGMSSRLFQEIREKRGLAYSTYAFDSAYSDCSLFGLYAGCAPQNIAAVKQLMWQQLEDIATTGIPEAEMQLCLGQLKGGILLGLENNRARMSRLGRSEVNQHRLRTVAQTIASLENIAAESVSNLAQELLDTSAFEVIVGPKGEKNA